jgi:hypothetical protein
VFVDFRAASRSQFERPFEMKPFRWFIMSRFVSHCRSTRAAAHLLLFAVLLASPPRADAGDTYYYFQNYPASQAGYSITAGYLGINSSTQYVDYFGLVMSNGVQSYDVSELTATGANRLPNLDIMSSPGGGSEIVVEPGYYLSLQGLTDGGENFGIQWSNESSSGTFLEAGAATPPNFSWWNLFYSAPSPSDAFGLPTGGNWIIAVAPPPPPTHNPGDANGDGKVDINDLTIVLTNYDHTGMVWSQGCMDGDPAGTVDINDLTIVLTDYGTTYSAANGSKAVPEPASLVLLAAGAIALLAFAKRKRAP